MNDTNVPIQLSTFRRVINFVRFWSNLRANVTVVLHNQSQVALANQNMAAHLRRLNARLDYYEHTVPLLGKAGAQFRAHERKLMQSAEAEANYAEREARRAAEGPVAPAPPGGPKLEVAAR